MKKFLCTLAVCVGCATFSLSAQVITFPVSSPSPVNTQVANARYEFIQSNVNTAYAFLLDKYTGDVWRYKISNRKFEKISKEGSDRVDVSQVNYQIYMSGDNKAECFLLNIHTGQVWQYESGNKDKVFEMIAMPWAAQ